MAHILSILFWIYFALVYHGLPEQLKPDVYWATMVILLTIRYLLISSYEIPTAAFWVLFIILLPTMRINSRGTCFFLVLIVQGLDFKPDGICFPGACLNPYVAAIILVIWLLLPSYGYPGGGLALFIAMIVLRNEMYPFNQDFGWGWLGAWWCLQQALVYALAPAMPFLWYPMWVAIIIALGFGLHPEQSRTRFILWAASIFVLRFVLFFFYIFYYLGTAVREDMFPFNLFSHKWKKSIPPWEPLSLRNRDSLNQSALCARCDELTRGSKLIMGSSSYFTRLVEWHDFGSRVDFCSKFKNSPSAYSPQEGISTFPETSCGLCCLLWYSMSPRRQKAIVDSITTNEDDRFIDSSLPRPLNPDEQLRVKVWEERPLSLYTYAQLFWGDVVIGARLLIHRNELFVTRKPSFLFKLNHQRLCY